MKTRVVLITLLLIVVGIGCAIGAIGQDDNQRFLEINSHMDQGDYAYVIDEMPLYLEDYPESYLGWNVLGWAYLKNGQLEKAEESFDRAIAINEAWDNGYVGKGALYRKLGDLDKDELALQVKRRQVALKQAMIAGQLQLGDLDKDELALQVKRKQVALKQAMIAVQLQSQQQPEPRAASRGRYNVSQLDFEYSIDRNRGAPAIIRAFVGGIYNRDDRLATLRNYYPDAEHYGDDNFVFTDPHTGAPTLYNPTGFDLGDVASVGREATQVVTSAGGAALGTLAGPKGTVLGAGAGNAAGGVLWDQFVQYASDGKVVDSRTPGQKALDSGV